MYTINHFIIEKNIFTDNYVLYEGSKVIAETNDIDIINRRLHQYTIGQLSNCINLFANILEKYNRLHINICMLKMKIHKISTEFKRIAVRIKNKLSVKEIEYQVKNVLMPCCQFLLKQNLQINDNIKEFFNMLNIFLNQK